MNVQDRRGLCGAAAETLAQTPDHRKLALIWAGVAAAVGLLSSLLSFLLNSPIANTGGLDGIGMRSVLSTVQFALPLFASILLPFWNIGHTAAALEMSRSRQARPGTLLEGFHRFGPVLRFLLLQGVVYLALGILTMNVASILLSLTPLSASLMEQMVPLLEGASASAEYQIDQATGDAFLAAMIPSLICWGVLYFAVCIPVSYRLRMAQLRLMDEPRCGALNAMSTSFRMMRCNCLSLFLLDLRFWWFYLAEVLLAALSYGDILLPLLGITLPFSEEAASFLFYVVALAAQVTFYTFAKNQLAVTYAKFYDALTHKA